MRTLVGLFTLAVAMFNVSLCTGADWPQFRGPMRDGISRETGLLKRWPEEGPEMVWSVEGLGTGFASVSVAGQMIYTTGMIEGTGYLFAIGTDGRERYRKAYGPEWTGSYPGARTTPTIDGDRLYIMSGHGRVVCLDRATGDILWKVDTLEQFRGKNIKWGISESVLVHEDRVFCTPGGQDATMVALNKYTGETIWTTRGLSNLSAYCSPILYRTPNKQLLLTMVRKRIICVDSENGEVLWTIPHETRNDIAAVTPAGYCQGRAFFTSHGIGGRMVRFDQDGRNHEVLWSNPALDSLHGGVVLTGAGVGLCGSDSKGNWISQNIATGEVISSEKLLDAKGCIMCADGMLYCYSEKGTLGLVKPTREGLELISSFKITRGTGAHWAHPVVCHGILYIRHGEVLMAFDVKED